MVQIRLALRDYFDLMKILKWRSADRTLFIRAKQDCSLLETPSKRGVILPSDFAKESLAQGTISSA